MWYKIDYLWTLEIIENYHAYPAKLALPNSFVQNESASGKLEFLVNLSRYQRWWSNLWKKYRSPPQMSLCVPAGRSYSCDQVHFYWKSFQFKAETQPIWNSDAESHPGLENQVSPVALEPAIVWMEVLVWYNESRSPFRFIWYQLIENTDIIWYGKHIYNLNI